MTDALLWLDLETTGTDETKDSIIEIGVVATTTDLTILGEWVSLVRPTDEALGRLLRTPVVLAMHEENQLFHELMEAEGVPTIGAVDHQLHEWMNDVGNYPTPVSWVLAGSGVGHFDRRFIKAQMPKLDRRLRHWCIDVGVLRRAHQMWSGDTTTPWPNDMKTHRALDDAYVHLAEARQWRDFFRETTEPE